MPALEAGEMEAFQEWIDVDERLADEIGQPLLRYHAGLGRALRETLAGRYDRAEQLALEILEMGSNNGQADAFIYCAAFLVQMRIDQGRLGEMVGFIDQTDADAPDAPHMRPARAVVYCERGRTAEARSILEAEAANGFRAIPFDLNWANSMNLYARVAATLDDPGAAGLLVDLMEPWRDQIASGAFGLGSLAHSLGLLLTTVGRYDKAEDAFAQAATVHERIGAPLLLARTRLEWARLLGRRDRPGDRARAYDLARAAHSVAVDLGAGSIERGASALL
jgi:tetratricopeptide (TPR) repeat protein